MFRIAQMMYLIMILTNSHYEKYLSALHLQILLQIANKKQSSAREECD